MKRFNCEYLESYADMLENKDGKYVLYSEHKSEVDFLEAKVRALYTRKYALLSILGEKDLMIHDLRVKIMELEIMK
jgi:hypothetical protein